MKIAEVSERYGLSSDTLRYYERIGLLPPVNRAESGIRDYNDLTCGGWSSSSVCAAPGCPSRC